MRTGINYPMALSHHLTSVSAASFRNSLHIVYSQIIFIPRRLISSHNPSHTIYAADESYSRHNVLRIVGDHGMS